MAPKLLSVVLLIGLAGLVHAQVGTGQDLRGMVLSEVYSNAFNPTGQASYIEIWNRDRTQPARLSGARILLATSTGVARTFIFPTNAPPLAPNATAVLAAAAIPGAGTAGVDLFVDSGFFATPALAPGTVFNVCLEQLNASGAVVRTDSVAFGGTITLCGGGSFQGRAVPFRAGFALRVLRVDSDTDYDWHDVVRPVPPPLPPATVPLFPSPGQRNPQIARVNGFTFGITTRDGFTLPVPPLGPASTTGNTVNVVSAPRATTTLAPFNETNGRIRAILIPMHPDPTKREIRDNAFDRVLSQGVLQTSGQFRGLDALLAGSTGDPLNWRVVVPPTVAGQAPGTLIIDMGPQSEVGARFFINPNPTTGNGLVVERILTDNQTDSTANGNGDLTEVQIEVLPDPNGPPGDVWCDVILYADSGHVYKGKAKNWPPNPASCASPTLALSSPAVGRIDIIALCFQPLEEIFVLPSLTTVQPVGTGPVFGLAPDALTLAVLALPIDTDPFHVQCTVDGLYFASYDGFVPGLTIDALAVAWNPMSGFGTPSPVARVQVQ